MSSTEQTQKSFELLFKETFPNVSLSALNVNNQNESQQSVKREFANNLTNFYSQLQMILKSSKVLDGSAGSNNEVKSTISNCSDDSTDSTNTNTNTNTNNMNDMNDIKQEANKTDDSTSTTEIVKCDNNNNNSKLCNFIEMNERRDKDDAKIQIECLQQYNTLSLDDKIHISRTINNVKEILIYYKSMSHIYPDWLNYKQKKNVNKIDPTMHTIFRTIGYYAMTRIIDKKFCDIPFYRNAINNPLQRAL